MRDGALFAVGVALAQPQLELRALLPVVLDECAHKYPEALCGMTADGQETNLLPALRAHATLGLWR